MFEIYDILIMPLNHNGHFYFYVLDCIDKTKKIQIYQINSMFSKDDKEI